jgi:omega-6 fatty acid desaturase (delta-12 desaturase)
MEAATLTMEARPTPKKAWWVEPLEPYAGADMRRSIACLFTSVVPYLLLWPLMYVLMNVSYFATLGVAVLASGFLLRTYIVFHDCGHGSFMPTKRQNTVIGTITALIVYSTFTSWRQEHAGHHAASGDIDRRGVGDVQTLTVSEYNSRPFSSRLGYRLIRSPWVMFTVGPLWALAIAPRFIPMSKRRRMQLSHLYTDLGLAVLISAVVLLIGWKAYLMIQLPLVLMAGASGVFLFYVQHQFEGVYWVRSEEWNFVDAALRGCSYLKLPKVLQFFTGNIGLHHVHHLMPRIPNYNLQRAHDENEFFHATPTLSFRDALKTVRFKLIDEDTGQLLTFAQARRCSSARSLSLQGA